MRVFLDMDGVCCDFNTGVARLLGKRLPTEWPLGEDLTEVLSVSQNELWDAVETAGERFWSGLRPYPWFKALYAALLRETRDVFFLTSPSRHGSSLLGKQRWLNEHVGPSFDKVIFTRHKELLAGPDTHLIDDDERFVSAFHATGGNALLFKQPWNGHETPLNPVVNVLSYLREET